MENNRQPNTTERMPEGIAPVIAPAETVLSTPASASGTPPILQVNLVCKLYGMNKSDAAKMMREGADKETVYKKTGCTVALWDVSFKVQQGEIFAIIGLSGSGKSTIIRCLNMLNRPTSGSVYFKDRAIDKLSKKELMQYRRNDISMVFQSFGLMSHRDVLGNVAYGLEVRGMSKSEREAKAMEMIEMVGLGGCEHSAISQLSGGMRQRVGIARALTSDSEILLMDEPFSALDPLVRSDMQFELLSLQRKLGKTVVFITHDINEAFKLGDTVAIMRDGKVDQIDTPERMSAHPANDYVKKFIDSADKTKVLTVRHVMTAPGCIVRIKDPVDHAIKQMRRNEVSSAYVVDEKMHLRGVLTIDTALEARKAETPLRESLITGVETTAPDALINDVLPIAARTKYPIAVVDEESRLMGIVSRASVLSSLI